MNKQQFQNGLFTTFLIISIATMLIFAHTRIFIPMADDNRQNTIEEIVDDAVEQRIQEIPDPCTLEDVWCEGEGTLRTVYAYTSTVEETDETPCIAADGTDICHIDHAVCAANFVPFGTILEIQGAMDVGFYPHTCVVHDRMNARYPEAVDVYFGTDRTAAMNFGVQHLLVKIIK